MKQITDHLIIGSGLAGMLLALKIAQGSKGQKVSLITKGPLLESNSFYAQGGIASVLGPGDSFEEHIQDTLKAGAGLCHEERVRQIVEGGPKAISDLIAFGVPFTKEAQGYHLTQEGGHSQRRVVHAQDATGRAIMESLARAIRHHPRIEVWENRIGIDLITTDRTAPKFLKNRCLGAYVLHSPTQEISQFLAPKTYIATGGHGRLYLYSSNPPGATGDGLAMGYRAGCRVANLEFMQFHPTCLFHPAHTRFLISEALRGEGALIRNKKGELFIKEGSLAPRDIVARAIDYELKKTGETHVYLDVSPLGEDKLKKLFPNIYTLCRDLGIALDKEGIPVVPAAHYSCGGILIDEDGRTGIQGLFALGEVACSGLHGANRLASNSLLEACVLADRVAAATLIDPQEPMDLDLPPWDEGQAIPSHEQVILSHNWDELRRLMWNYVGIVRSQARLKKALRRIELIREEVDEYYWKYRVNRELLEVRNLVCVAWLTVRCALRRKESRGIHYTLDQPETLARGIDTIL